MIVISHGIPYLKQLNLSRLVTNVTKMLECSAETYPRGSSKQGFKIKKQRKIFKAFVLIILRVFSLAGKVLTFKVNTKASRKIL